MAVAHSYCYELLILLFKVCSNLTVKIKHFCEQSAYCAYLYHAAAWLLSLWQSQLTISPAELLSWSLSPVWCLCLKRSQLPISRWRAL